MDTDNTQRAIAFLNSYVPHGLGAVRDMITEDFSWWTPTSGQIEHRLEEIKSKTKAFYSAPPQFSISGTTAEGDRVAVEAASDALLVNGKHYHNTYHFLLLLRDGKIAAVREYSNTKHVAEVWAGLL